MGNPGMSFDTCNQCTLHNPPADGVDKNYYLIRIIIIIATQITNYTRSPMLGYILRYDEINLIFQSAEITYYVSVKRTVRSLKQEINTGNVFEIRFSCNQS